MYSPQKLHPISYILSLITAIKDNFILIVVFLIFQLDSFDFTDLKNYVWPGILTILFVLSFLRRSVEIFRTRYWIENEYFVLTSGLFNLERKELNIKRIQSVDITQNIVHQLVGGRKTYD
ncbi:membrane-flanked domain-containing protein [Staphylococcus schleiferi]|uniref:Membrane-flanked domain-containing protein n=1 Tax=Staphylococcus schleiferi TaxID=1295 RepID=A0A7Z7QP20_STASC|nr:PH domain-containing protein [Staphylococcus schleiferi]CAD7359211.1 membrane-flanked domain-containing protein [Staphylococcus schleiferi]SUM87881.1 membrane-flanked domain-containing protein [Staphylococcus schleiferi]